MSISAKHNDTAINFVESPNEVMPSRFRYCVIICDVASRLKALSKPDAIKVIAIKYLIMLISNSYQLPWHLDEMPRIALRYVSGSRTAMFSRISEGQYAII